jgi:hypothetical protein
MNRNCVASITDAIKQAEDRFACRVGVSIFDTYSKGIAAGGGDENQAKDQNIAIANLRRVTDQTGIHAATIGHTGKDESRGERGSNAKQADVDLQVQITGDAVKTAIVRKANDQPEGELTSFQLEPYDFAPDEDGDPFRTYILSKELVTGAAPDQALSDREQLAMEALTETLLAHGRPGPAEYGLPAGITVVSEKEWMTELLQQRIIDPGATNPRARFTELRNRLKRRT